MRRSGKGKLLGIAVLAVFAVLLSALVPSFAADRGLPADMPEGWSRAAVEAAIEIAKEITGKRLTLEEYLNRLPVGNVAPPEEEWRYKSGISQRTGTRGPSVQDDCPQRPNFREQASFISPDNVI